MRLLYLAGVAIIGFATGGDAKGSRVLESDVSNQPKVHVVSTSVESTTSFLRARSTIDEERAGGGISVSGTDKLAKLFKSSKVTDEQLQKWLSKGKAAESVFYRMNLADARITRLFDSPQFIRWLQYADDLSASGKGPSAISVLSTQYGDDTLYKMIGWAKKESSTKALGTRLQADQLEHWVKTRKDPDEVFKLYDLNYVGWRILSKPQFSAWTKYVDDLNAKNEGAMVSIIPTLRKYFSDDDLFKIAEAAKRVDELESMGLKLENAFVQFWINDKQTPAKVLAELRLEATTKTLESPLFSLLAKYTDAYNVKFPQTKTTMIETFTDAFGDENVAKMLTAVKANEWKAKKIATELEAAQLQMWFSSGKSFDDVYDLLKLPDKYFLYDLRESPLFPTWIAYINKVSIENPDKVYRLLSTMATQFKDRPMMQILQAAEKFPSMESVAVTLQLQKAEKLFATGVSPYDAFTKVALDSVGDAVLGSPLFTKWMSYVDDFNKKYPEKEESWFLSLHGNYNNVNRLIETAQKNPKTAKIADMVEKAQMDEWLKMQRLPEHVFHFLNLDKAGKKVFTSPNFELWVKYLNDFNKKYPDKKTTMIESIRKNYRDLHLIRILDKAEKVPSTEKLAKDLQNALIDKWVDEKITVAYLERWIGHVKSSNVWIERYTEKLNKLS